jgi:hypothetical protein
MRMLAKTGLLALGVGFVLAQFLVLFYNHWYFSTGTWVKTGLLAVPLALGYAALLLSPSRVLWLRIGLYWLAAWAVAVFNVRSFDLRAMGFTDILNYEAAVVWVPTVWAAAHYWLGARRALAAKRRPQLQAARQLALRRRVRAQGSWALATAGAPSVELRDPSPAEVEADAGADRTDVFEVERQVESGSDTLP